MTRRSRGQAESAQSKAPSLVDLYSQMLRIRRFEERCAELYSAERIRGFVHLYIGQEAVAAGLLANLTAEDAVVATYREHGHALARGVPMTAVMAEMFGRLEGACRGRGGSMHLFHAPSRFYGGNAIVGAGLPLAVGLALADSMQGRNRITACFFGEGAMAEGAFHEAMNLAALWRLPVLFCCENNRYAMGTALNRSQSQVNLAVKAASYEMPAWTCDGMDVSAVSEAPSSWRRPPSAFGPIRCTTLIDIGTGLRSSTGRSATRSWCADSSSMSRGWRRGRTSHRWTRRCAPRSMKRLRMRMREHWSRWRT